MESGFIDTNRHHCVCQTLGLRNDLSRSHASYFLAIDDILEKFNSPGHIHAVLEYTKL